LFNKEDEKRVIHYDVLRLFLEYEDDDDGDLARFLDFWVVGKQYPLFHSQYLSCLHLLLDLRVHDKSVKVSLVPNMRSHILEIT